MSAPTETQRSTGQAARASSARSVDQRYAASATPPQQPDAGAKRLDSIVKDFAKRAQSVPDHGARPGTAERLAASGSWQQVDTVADLVFRAIGKNYDLSRMMMQHYVTSNGAPLAYSPPQPVQDAIAARFPAPGRYRDISGYGKWSTPDIRNGLGHFDLDVIALADGTKAYVITDRYTFPDKVGGKTVAHGFQVGKLPKPVVDQVNSVLSSLTFVRESGKPDNRFELGPDPTTGDYTLFVPQRLIVDHGVDFESMGVFLVGRKRM